MVNPNDATSVAQEIVGDTEPYRPGYEVAAEKILQYVAELALPPGSRLPTQKEIATIIGVSPPVAREAIRTLAALGRLTVRKGAGIFVAEPKSMISGHDLHLFLPADIDQVYMLFELRRTLEREASSLAAARAAPLEIKAINAAVEDAFEAAEAEDFTLFRAADDAFHQAVARAAHNMFFDSTIGAVIDLRHQVIAIGLSGSGSGPLREAAAQHAAVAQAISAGDSLGAAEAMGSHVDVTLEQFRSAISHRLFATQADGAGPTDRELRSTT